MLGSKDNPLRCSKFNWIVRCTMNVFLSGGTMFNDEDELGGPAAQTGNLTHLGVAEFHRLTGDLAKRRKAAFDVIHANAAKFPEAEINDCKLFLQPYTEDPRNIYAEIYHHQVLNKITDRMESIPIIEHQFKFTLPPHEIDPTECEIHCQGTCDQIRIVDGIPEVYDLKTGKISGFQMQHDYLYQMCGYAYGARQMGISGCQPGKIIRAYGYRQRDAIGESPQGVFWGLPPYKSVDDIIDAVRLGVALYRMGHLTFGAGPHCTYCPHGGIFGCTQKLEELRVRV